MIRASLLALATLSASSFAADLSKLPPAATRAVDFVKDIQPIFDQACIKCHGPEKQKSGYRVDVKANALSGGENHAPNIIAGKSADSPLIHFVAGLDAEMQMPPKDAALSGEQIGLLRKWIDDGAVWPQSANAKIVDKSDWWSLKPPVKPAVPVMAKGNRNAVDAFLSAKLAEKNLVMSPEANARTLCRRIYFDLTGLPPSFEEMEAFAKECADPATGSTAYERLVDKLLASPRYGERWARHWLDVVHFGETHGYDKDQPRPNAWPYRDYVIKAFNEDKPYTRFVEEQLAGDVLFPGTADGITALGFISAGPWDFIGHAEVGEDKIDGKIARHLDRDDMSANTINTFCSMTVHCAQCHDHKFDPISAEDYYSLQSVFAALDRSNRPYDEDPAVSKKRSQLQSKKQLLKARVDELNNKALSLAREELTSLDKKMAEVAKPSARQTQGWHANIENQSNVAKWVQVDLGSPAMLSQVVLHPCSDNFNQIGDGFGFPPRFKVEISNDAEFKNGVTTVADETTKDFANPGIKPVAYGVGGSARFVRVTATSLASRKGDFIFSLAELDVMDSGGKNLAAGSPVTSLDTIEAPGAWSRNYLTDQLYPGADPNLATASKIDKTKLQQARKLIVEAVLGGNDARELTAAEKEFGEIEADIKSLPPAKLVYAGTIHTGSAPFAGTGANGGKPRMVTVLSRGDVRKPGREALPGAISGIRSLPSRFELPSNAGEGERRAALAHWITDAKHPLTWRTMVNRVWQYHFGRGIVDTPNDFGHMGGLPTHPELLDWLAVSFRDDMKGSVKQLHKLIVTSSAYRQQSDVVNETAAQFDSGNTLLWRQNRRKLEAEAIRDSVLMAAGKLDLKMGGPSFQDFVITHPEHSPHYEYQLSDPENPAIHRRSIYRFLVRSQQQPWMASLDCADPSMLVEKRNQTITPLQALAQLNNQLMVVMAKHFAERAKGVAPDLGAEIAAATRIALQREATAEELKELTDYAAKFGLAATCRVLLNLNEFVFVD